MAQHCSMTVSLTLPHLPPAISPSYTQAKTTASFAFPTQACHMQLITTRHTTTTTVPHHTQGLPYPCLIPPPIAAPCPCAQDRGAHRVPASAEAAADGPSAQRQRKRPRQHHRIDWAGATTRGNRFCCCFWPATSHLSTGHFPGGNNPRQMQTPIPLPPPCTSDPVASGISLLPSRLPPHPPSSPSSSPPGAVPDVRLLHQP